MGSYSSSFNSYGSPASEEVGPDSRIREYSHTIEELQNEVSKLKVSLK